MKNLTVEQVKVMLRETGVKVRPKYDHGWAIGVSSALKEDHKVFLSRQSRQLGVTKSNLVNRYVLNFQALKADHKMTLGYDAAKSTAGYLDKKVVKVFGNRANVKFTSFTMEKPNWHKLNDLSDYYGISRSGVIRLIIESNM